jgi:hypothetical protein
MLVPDKKGENATCASCNTTFEVAAVGTATASTA